MGGEGRASRGAVTRAMGDETWIWPIDASRYDRTPALTAEERDGLAPFAARRIRDRLVVVAAAAADPRLDRLRRPLADALAAIDGAERPKGEVAFLLLRECAHLDQPFWAWGRDTWLEIVCPSQAAFLARHKPGNQTHLRQYVIAVAYLLGLVRDVHALGGIEMARLARKVFGAARLAALLAPLVEANAHWGYRPGRDAELVGVAAAALLCNGHPDPRRLTRPALEEVRAALAPFPHRRPMVYRLSRILAHLGWLDDPLPLPGGIPGAIYKEGRERGIAPEWVRWVERWYATSTRSPRTRGHIRGDLLRVGRWLAAEHPEVTEPSQWTRALSAEFVAAVDRMRSGDFAMDGVGSVPIPARGQPFSAQRKHGLLSALRGGFGDAQEWGWIERRFDPQRAFATPRSVRLLLGPAPRVIPDDIWAKPLWAGLNLAPADCPPLGHHRPAPGAAVAGAPGGPRPEPLTFYPPEMTRALALLWLFAGLRSDELIRLRVGCIRPQRVVGGNGSAADGAAPVPVCLLDVPVNKTGSAFTKPVDPLVGEAVAAWEAVRPAQPDLLDPKTGERVAFLFCYRAKRLSRAYLNHSLIPALCAKGGVPRSDARGRISSHRARSTIASQLFNAREPMSLFELQAWLGHRSPASTQHYVAITPTTLARAYDDAGYFARNLRAIAVLIDRDAVEGGAAAAGAPWQYFDLGHGYCTYSFFDQCPHRMACARCDFYLPKGSTKAQLLEAKGNLQRMLASIPLTDDERAAVEDGAEALDHLLERLADVPTPAGPTPRQLGRTPLPVISPAFVGEGGG